MSITNEQPTTNLFALTDLGDARQTRELQTSDLDALRTVAEWITTFVAQPHKDLGRPGPICPFVPEALERNTLWLASEHVSKRSVPDVVERLRDYQRLFEAEQPIDGDDATYKSFVIVFADVPEDRADEFFGEVLEQLALPSYVKNGFVMGGFHKNSAGTAIYNATFRPFTSPVPFLLMRHAVVSDWKFFVDDDAWLMAWAHRFGDAGAQALGEELRRLPWRMQTNNSD